MTKLNRRHILAAAAGLTTAGAAGAATAQSAPVLTKINHVSMAARNLFQAAHALRAETGIGFYDGGFNANGSASKIFPLGGGAYLIVEGLVDALALEDASNTAARELHASVAKGDVFRGFCVRAPALADLQAVATRHKWTVPALNRNAGRIQNDGSRLAAVGVPPVNQAWPKGLPNFNYFPDSETHPAGQPVITTAGLVRPEGIAWLEVGGSQADMTAWVGPGAAQLPLRFNGQAPGVYALAVKAAGKEVVIRRPPAPVA